MSDTPHRTPLYELHLKLGSRMTVFSNYAMPLQYTQGAIKEHLQVRESAGLFDVSHMGQVMIRGPHVDRELEQLLPADLEALPTNRQLYTLLTNNQGGILDDLIITRRSKDELYLVLNSANKQSNINYLTANLETSELVPLDTHALISLQGPSSMAILETLAPEAASMTFMSGGSFSINGTHCYISRSGYTGEDGFELSIPNQDIERIAQTILQHEAVAPVGLAARNSLRMEAGLCLYGEDLTAETSPIEAGLSWTIAKSRLSQGSKEGGFPGSDSIIRQLREGAQRKRLGLIVQGRIPIREGAVLLNDLDQEVGQVTSGGYSPSLKRPIAMGYADSDYAKPDTELKAMLRGQPHSLIVTKLPFVRRNYFRG